MVKFACFRRPARSRHEETFHSVLGKARRKSRSEGSGTGGILFIQGQNMEVSIVISSCSNNPGLVENISNDLNRIYRHLQY